MPGGSPEKNKFGGIRKLVYLCNTKHNNAMEREYKVIMKRTYDTVIDYLEDDDTMNDIDEITPNNITKADFDAACRKYLIAEVCAEWEQDLLACVLLTEEQFKLIQSFKV